MSKFSEKEYAELLDTLLNQQYGDFIDPEEEENWENNEWTVPDPKEKILRAQSDKCIDLTKTARKDIKDLLFTANNIKVGGFLIKIKKYKGTADKCEAALYMDIILYEEKLKTPSGRDCKMVYPLNPYKDNRFAGCDWLNYFQIPLCGHDIPTDVVVEVVKWLQVIKKINAFT